MGRIFSRKSIRDCDFCVYAADGIDAEKGYIGGVCHGLGEHTNIDPVIWRIVTVFGGLGFAYLVLWIVLKSTLDCFKKGEV